MWKSILTICCVNCLCLRVDIRKIIKRVSNIIIPDLNWVGLLVHGVEFPILCNNIGNNGVISLVKGIENCEDITGCLVKIGKVILCEYAAVIKYDCSSIRGIDLAINNFGSGVKKQDLPCSRCHRFWHSDLKILCQAQAANRIMLHLKP